MILIKPTTHGYGVQIIGTREDLETLYVAIGKCWNPEEPTTQSNMLASFSYDIRHTFMGYDEIHGSLILLPRRMEHSSP
jgi:hypothetical protein